MADAPIGLFDSGEGGLTVARAVAAQMPGESLLYACDGAHFPYGPRPLSEVRSLFLRFWDYFCTEGCKLVVIACNTATAAALGEVQRAGGPAVLGVVEPGASAAATGSHSGRIGVLATQATVLSGVYVAAIERLRPGAQVVQAAAPLLVTMAENGDVASEAAAFAAQAAVAPLLAADVDTVVLGCTHFPHMRAHLERAVGPDITLVDPGQATAQAVREMLGAAGRLGSAGRRRFMTTGDPARFTAVATQLWPGGVTAAAHLSLAPSQAVAAGAGPGGDTADGAAGLAAKADE